MKLRVKKLSLSGEDWCLSETFRSHGMHDWTLRMLCRIWNYLTKRANEQPKALKLKGQPDWNIRSATACLLWEDTWREVANHWEPEPNAQHLYRTGSKGSLMSLTTFRHMDNDDSCLEALKEP